MSNLRNTQKSLELFSSPSSHAFLILSLSPFEYIKPMTSLGAKVGGVAMPTLSLVTHAIGKKWGEER